MTQPFLTFWEQRYGTIPPLGWKLKLALPDRWLRIHTLPASKRYPSTDAEAAEVAERQVTAARSVFEEGAPVWLVTWRYRASVVATDLAQASEEIGVPHVGAGVLAGDAQDQTIDVLVARIQWSVPSSSSLRRAIAADTERAMWVHDRTAEVFAPYDGGVDLIFSSPERRDEYKARFSAWLSARPDGL